MDFRLLGPLEVITDDGPADVGTGKRAALLTYLLINANEVISADRLIEELWNEHAPATATKIVQGYVSQLRKALHADGELLITRGSGYVLALDDANLDIKRFERGLSDAERALEDGDAERAVKTARDALALWRGPALYDVAYESFAQREAARLEELRLVALETRIEAELAVGKHRQLVSELEALVAEHSTRERFRAQLMLALYRCGRQSDALDVYRQGRRLLMDELGLEPGPELRELEQKILTHSADLGRPRASYPTMRRRRTSEAAAAARTPRRRGHGARLLVAGGALLAAVATWAVLERAGGGGESSGQARDATALLDPTSGKVLDSVPVGRTPTSVALGAGSVWVLNADDQTISRIDAKSKRVQTFGIGTTPTDVAYGGGALWIGNAFRNAKGSYPRSISRIDPGSGVVDATVALPTHGAQDYFQGGGNSEQHIAATNAAVWAINPDETISRIDPKTGRRVATITGVRAINLAADEKRAWVVEADGVVPIDVRTNRVGERIKIAAESLTTVALGAGAVWVADPLGGSVWRVDPGAAPRLRQIPLDIGVRGVAFGRGAAWATNEIANKVYRIDPRTNRARVVNRVVAAQQIAVGATGVWVTALGRPSRAATLPADVCGSVAAGGTGTPDVLVVSDLPLKGIDREITVPMVDAIRFVLERRGFKAGRHSIGYQSCDAATAQTGGSDIYRCFENGKAYARSPHVVGVIGSYASYCSMFEIPVLSQAPGGPVAMISPSNTLNFLTRPHPTRWLADVRQLYPSGKRNFVRIAASDHASAGALVEAARQLHRRRVFLLSDGEDVYSAGYAIELRRAARAKGLEVTGAAHWNPRSRNFAALARRVAATKPDAVMLAGYSGQHPRPLLGDLRSGLGRKVALIANDGFANFEGLPRVAGSAATGLYVGNWGVPNAQLPTAGRRFVAEFKRTRQGRPGPDQTAAYAAQAAGVLLDAIARSDGTRASVTRELRRTRIENSLLGNISFDRNGDLAEAPVTIYRFTSHGAVVDRVITVRTDGS